MSWLRALGVTLVFVCACGGASRPAAPEAPPPKPQLPELEGRAVYDVPVGEASGPVQRLWAAVDAARGDRLADAGGMAAVRDWVPRRVEAIKAARGTAQAVVAGGAEPRDRLFAAVVVAWLLDDVIAQLHALPPPPEIARNSEAVAAFRGALDDRLGTVAHEARVSYKACAEAAPAAPAPLQPWAAECARRAEALRELAQREPPAPVRVVAPHAACEAAADAKTAIADPIAPPPDRAAPSEIAILVDGDRFTGADRDKLRAAIFARLFARLPGQRFVPLADLDKAARLVGQRRWRDRGPVCGQPPPLPALLAPRHKHLILARVEPLCIQEPAACGLYVGFSRAGSDDGGGLPAALSGKVTGDPASLDAWLLAAASLGDGQASGILATITGSLASTDGYFDLAGIADDDPWLRVGPTLRDPAVASRLTACRRGMGSTAYTAAWTVGKAGAATGVQVIGLQERLKDAEGEGEKRCIAEVLRTVAWPCPRSGKPARVEATVCIGK